MKILIVEDDFRIAEMYKEYLLKNAPEDEIHIALNAAESLKTIQNHDINLMLVDIYLPDMHGDKLIENVLKQYPYMNFIVVTASQESEKVKNAMQLGALYYLVKPVKLDKLSETVNDYKKKNVTLSKSIELEQDDIDMYFGRIGTPAVNSLPKGIDPLTLKKIEEVFSNQHEWTSSQLGEHLGTSRTTVRRYLEYMRELGKLTVSQDFGDKGRPEKKYRKNLS
ncbi:Transcriptional regulatory protein CitT [Jeotgalicoccus saudimassiliensis]|uniref:Transcriptional regulatory protein n=1 Tax=Jeotgalicoccus saudimassiliensis TaxID=1461582 RepID=A0A078M337_9STAP|nr:response regulator [Jeotgalicoccus saudimassiliensis]MDO5360183.1 response regulator [Jeotgalicoccus sp.]CEA02008.1 Transcriptional regulatory protein CitT [Jeotgalicoccus saudimassiliensis]